MILVCLSRLPEFSAELSGQSQRGPTHPGHAKESPLADVIPNVSWDWLQPPHDKYKQLWMGRTNGQTDGWVDGQAMGRRIDGQTDGWMDGRMDGRMNLKAARWLSG